MPAKPEPARTRRSIDDFDADAANRERTQTLQRNMLQRKARAHGLELRHSSYGYSLVDMSRSRVDGRNDFTLDEVEKRLAATPLATPGPAMKRSGRRI